MVPWTVLMYVNPLVAFWRSQAGTDIFIRVHQGQWVNLPEPRRLCVGLRHVGSIVAVGCSEHGTDSDMMLVEVIDDTYFDQTGWKRVHPTPSKLPPVTRTQRLLRKARR